MGLMERKATHKSSRYTKVPGISPAMIRENSVGIVASRTVSLTDRVMLVHAFALITHLAQLDHSDSLGNVAVLCQVDGGRASGRW